MPESLSDFFTMVAIGFVVTDTFLLGMTGFHAWAGHGSLFNPAPMV